MITVSPCVRTPQSELYTIDTLKVYILDVSVPVVIITGGYTLNLRAYIHVTSLFCCTITGYPQYVLLLVVRYVVRTQYNMLDIREVLLRIRNGI